MPFQVSEDSLKLVQETVHAFLKSLLTSFKLGVVYPSPSADVPQKHNMQAFTVLRVKNCFCTGGRKQQKLSCRNCSARGTVL
jgi:hypothetical protein